MNQYSSWDALINLHGFAMHHDHCNISCEHCEHSAKLYFGPLLIKYGPNFPMGPYLKNLRCSQCGERGASPRATSHIPGKEQKPFFCPITQKSIFDCIKGVCRNKCKSRPIPDMGDFSD